MDGEEGTDRATATPAADAADADAPPGTDAERDQVVGDEVGAETDQPTPEQLQEQITKLTTQVSEAATSHATQMETARRQSDEAMGRARTRWDQTQATKELKDRVTTLASRVKGGEADVVEELVGLVHEAIDRPAREAEQFEGTTDAMQQGAASAFSFRVERLGPTKEEEQRYITLFRSGRHAELDQVLLEAEKTKWGAPATDTSEARRQEQADVAARRKGQGADLTRPRGGSRAGFKTKMEARNLHVQNKLTNAEMKQINADPNIPEQ